MKRLILSLFCASLALTAVGQPAAGGKLNGGTTTGGSSGAVTNFGVTVGGGLLQASTNGTVTTIVLPTTSIFTISNTWLGTFVGDGYGNASSMTNLLAHEGRLAWTTLNKLQNNKPVKVLWLGDSLATQDYQNIWRQSFMTNMLARYGTNGWYGGGYLIPNAWSPTTAGVGNISQVNDATAIWYEQLWRVTNGFTQTWSAYSVPDGFFDADEVSITYLRTNALANGTLTVKTVDDSAVTTTIATINCNGTYAMITTNIAINPARVKVQITASGGDVAFATPGVFWSGGTGVRYGTLGQGGLNNFLKDASWVSALAGYKPDLLLVIDANNTAGIANTFKLITALQTNLPFMDVVFVQMPTSSDDYVNNATALDAQGARVLIQAFAQTNKNTTYFDTYFYDGAALGYQAMTNNANGITMVNDGIHPSTTNPTIANYLGNKLYQLLGFEYTRSISDQLTNIPASSITGAPWLTNYEARSVYLLNGLVVKSTITTTGSVNQVQAFRRDNNSAYTGFAAYDSAPLLFLDSTFSLNPMFYVSNRSDHYAMGMHAGYSFTPGVPSTFGEYAPFKLYGTNSWLMGNTYVGTAYGNGAGLSNAVDIIAGSGISVVTNGNKRSYTIASTAAGTSTVASNSESVFWSDTQWPADYWVVDANTRVGTNVMIKYTAATEGVYTLQFFASITSTNLPGPHDSYPQAYVYYQNNTSGSNDLIRLYTLNDGAASSAFPGIQFYTSGDNYNTFGSGNVNFWLKAGQSLTVSNTHIQSVNAGDVNAYIKSSYQLIKY